MDGKSLSIKSRKISGSVRSTGGVGGRSGEAGSKQKSFTGSDLPLKPVKDPALLDLKTELLEAYYDVNGKITEHNIEELFFEKYNIKDPIVKGIFRLSIDNFSEMQKIYPLNKKITHELSLKKKEYNKLLTAHNKEVEEIKNYYGAVIFYLVGFLVLTNISTIWSILGYFLP